jgi:hypothetical protein
VPNVCLLPLVQLLATVALAQPPLVAVRPSAEAKCPSAVEIEAALLARLPGVVVPFDRAIERHALLLALVANSDASASELTLADAEGRVRLRRSLAGTAEKKDCGALAETAALMVERYLVELDERAATAARGNLTSPSIAPLITPAEPEPTWTLALGGGYMVGPLRGDAFDLAVRATRLLGPNRDVIGHVRVGAGPGFDPIPASAGYDGAARIRRFPVEIGASWQRALPVTHWTLEAGAGGGFDIHQVRVSAAGGGELAETLLAPHTFVETAGRYLLTRQVFLRIGVAALMHWLSYDFSRSNLAQDNGDGGTGAVFSLPAHRIQARITAEIGLSLPLMKSWSTRP